ncbi:pilus assembly protein PilX [Pseudomonas gingeri NCPPB 3146 = LMG 5327]|uniref:Pilus assembly protein PilX n=2 Tax=Pseudomonas gingeri TaxID=117681 RepID=A0A7Y8CFP8_9PSED|nr:type 4 pilus major pilin [Pseudomonas gingeri]NWC16512.1 pilus assembly protein PilX [Pseudomonas gingeri]PNQ91128.1 pilus assembly protein PilX [Pseudomonas gingeri NCPPB 3146 = LMG 5327]
MQHSARNRQHGFIDLSMLFVLICIAIGIGYAIYNGGSLLSSSDVSNEQSNISQLIANTRKLKGSAGYGASGTDLVAQLVASKGLPNMSLSGSTLYNAWNGAVSVVSGGMNFVITDSGLAQDACMTLATKLSRGQKVTTSINGGSAVTGEVTSANAAASCTDTSNNTLAWTVF